MPRVPAKEEPKSRADAAALFELRTHLAVDSDRDLGVRIKAGNDLDDTLFELTGAVLTSECLRGPLALALAEKPQLAPWKTSTTGHDWSDEAIFRNEVRRSKKAVARLDRLLTKIGEGLVSIAAPLSTVAPPSPLVEEFARRVREEFKEVYSMASESLDVGERPAEYLQEAVLRLKDTRSPTGRKLNEPDIALLFLATGIRSMKSNYALTSAREWVHELAKTGRQNRKSNKTSWWSHRKPRAPQRPRSKQ